MSSTDQNSEQPESPETPGPFIDTHAHLDDPRILNDFSLVLDRAVAAGVEQVIGIASTAESSLKILEIAALDSRIFATVGIQPNHVAESRPGDWDRIAALISLDHVVALGETGLDRYWDHTPFPAQQEMFDRHLYAALEHDLPVVIHCRNSEAEIVSQLEKLGRPVRGVLHSFTGNLDQAEAFLELGLYLSFAGMVTFKNPSLDPLREVAASMPVERLLIETDSPYLSPHPYRGKTNEPSRVAITAERIAELRGVSLTEVGRQSTSNARTLFRLPERS